MVGGRRLELHVAVEQRNPRSCSWRRLDTAVAASEEDGEAAVAGDGGVERGEGGTSAECSEGGEGLSFVACRELPLPARFVSRWRRRRRGKLTQTKAGGAGGLSCKIHATVDP